MPRFRQSSGALLTAALLGGMVLLHAESASALPGTHAPAISSWDTRASNIVPSFSWGTLSGGHLMFVSYNANFSSTSGNLSAQFGMHYAQLREHPDEATLHGLGGGAVALISLPLLRRFENGLPKLGLNFFVGAVPTVLISGKFNYLEIPVVVGVGLTASPIKALSITPWFELAPSFNLDTVVHPYKLDPALVQNPGQFIDPATGEVNLSAKDVQRIVSDAVTVDPSFSLNARGGLTIAVHLGDAVDLNFSGAVGSLGSAFSGTRVIWGGGGVVYRWDNTVPAVLPAEKRLLNESCEDIEARFRTCPRYKPQEERPQAPEEGSEGL